MNYPRKQLVIINVSLLATLAVTTSVLLLSSPTSATTTSTTASVNVAEACTMYADITTPHTAIVSPNTYETDIGITTINVICNDPSGYAIYAVGYTGDEVGGENSTKLVSIDSEEVLEIVLLAQEQPLLVVPLTGP